MGARAIYDALPERGLRADAHEKRYGSCEHVAVGRVALGAEEEIGEGDDCYVSVFPSTVPVVKEKEEMLME